MTTRGERVPADQGEDLNFEAIYVQSYQVTFRVCILLIIGDRTQEVTRIVV